MKDWEIKPFSGQSALDGRPFAVGDSVVCVLYEKEGEMQRCDLTEEMWEQFQVPGNFLGRWRRIVKEETEDNEKRQARKEGLVSAEELFLSLFDKGSVSTEQGEALKQLLALILERKRILRSIGKVRGGQRYLHVKSKEEYFVPITLISKEQLLALQEKIPFC